MDWPTRVFIASVIAAGSAVLLYGAARPSSKNIAAYICYLLVAVLASRLKVDLPEITDTMSVNFLFILLGVLELSFSETVALGCMAALVQSFDRDRRSPLRLAFGLCASAVSIALAYATYHMAAAGQWFHSRPLLLAMSSSAYFAANTGSIATLVALSEQQSPKRKWVDCYFWSFPYYLVGAAIAGAIGWLNQVVRWEASLLALPVIYVIYRSYRLYLGKLESEKSHVDEIASLHLRTIEALALAIEAKDHLTHDHLQRVRVYAIEVAKELKVDPTELEALHAAALLHDIGKLAVPEHIISKPGRLTPEEFEKMKIHPVIGAEILERVHFPYPVVPIVRAHHEKWDGSGYPFGLRGEEIPIGARILSAVDFLDALASDRQYRRALPLQEVIKRLGQESGKAFDPQVVEVLERRYRELEKLVASRRGTMLGIKLSTTVKANYGVAPATGYENTAPKMGGDATFLSSIAAARQEAQTLFELSQDLGASLSLDETLSVFSAKMKRLVPYDAVAIYICRADTLVPEHVSGDNFRLLSSLRIPMGQGLSGWVAENRKPIVNGNPSVEHGYLSDPKFNILRSAMAVPLEGLAGVVGVLTVYHAEHDAFTTDHLRVLLAISSKMALAIENALKYEQAESSATTDFLTNLPNARSLFLQLEKELSRCKRDGSPLVVMVCDMDGFKQINDRFGHLEGNRVLRIFAQALKDSCREYDYVARMGGDEFVVIAPGLVPEAAGKKAELLRRMAQEAGRKVCGENILSLSVGHALFPNDGEDAEALLAAADRRMYQEKQQQPTHKNRRHYPRMKCRVTIELHPVSGAGPLLGNLHDISLGGCFVETNAFLSVGTSLDLVFSIDDGTLRARGNVLRIDPGVGVGVRFDDINRENRERVPRILEFVQTATTFYDNHYYSRMLST